MSAQTFGAKLPTHVTLDEVASMAAAGDRLFLLNDFSQPQRIIDGDTFFFAITP
ncbi:MAG: hypothetical protein SYR96_29060 [Actinomycetota bacterium]|nr:hypothetical protein [Actinomycetota bacterium]